MRPASHPFPVLRWCALVWTLVWFPAYFRTWGWTNLFHLCDVAVLLSVAGIWFGNRLLLSSQAVSSIAPGIFWLADVTVRLTTGRFLIGGTEYMFDSHYALWVRLLSTFHLFLPLILLNTLQRVGYDRRAFAFQSALAACLLIVSRFLSADLNMNYVYRDPVWHHAWAPGPLHVLITLVAIIAAIYLPTHLILRQLFPEIPLASSKEQTGQPTEVVAT
jgi:hypothetical protein